jgi:hypothetical protein
MQPSVSSGTTLQRRFNPALPPSTVIAAIM